MLHNKKMTLISRRKRFETALLVGLFIVLVALTLLRALQPSGSNILGQVRPPHAVDHAHAPR